MSSVIRYQVKPAFADENRELIRAVFDELHDANPGNVRYASFVRDDGLSFIHIVDHEPAGEANPLLSLPAFQRFQQDHGERCDVPPVVESIQEIGSYGFGVPTINPRERAKA